MRGRKRQFSGTDPGKIANSQIAIIAEKLQNLNVLQISFVMQCYLMNSIRIIMFGWKLCSKFYLIAIFPILAHFAAFLDHKKGIADVSKGG